MDPLSSKHEKHSRPAVWARWGAHRQIRRQVIRHKIGIVAGRILLMAGLAVASAGSQAGGTQAHATITEYLGPDSCQRAVAIGSNAVY